MPVGFAHEALFYTSDSDFVHRTAEFIAAGRLRGEPTHVLVPGDKIDALRGALGDLSVGVTFADIAEIGVNPARLIPAWIDFINAHADRNVPIRGVGQPICAQQSADELVECQRHEALLNEAFAETVQFSLLCPYDARGLAPSALAEARRSHPVVNEGGHAAASGNYRGGQELSAYETPLSPAPRSAITMVLTPQRLHEVRLCVEREAAALGMRRERIQDLTLAVTEISVNSLTHGRGAPVLSVWSVGDTLLAQVTDAGRLVAPALVGRRHPPLDGEGGRGLWLTHQLCDLVQVRAMASGTLVRLHQRL